MDWKYFPEVELKLLHNLVCNLLLKEFDIHILIGLPVDDNCFHVPNPKIVNVFGNKVVENKCQGKIERIETLLLLQLKEPNMSCD